MKMKFMIDEKKIEEIFTRCPYNKSTDINITFYGQLLAIQFRVNYDGIFCFKSRNDVKKFVDQIISLIQDTYKVYSTFYIEVNFDCPETNEYTIDILLIKNSFKTIAKLKNIFFKKLYSITM